MFPDAAIVDDDTPGASPKSQLEYGARQLAEGSTGLLISHVSVTKLMGAPLRSLCPGGGLEGDRAWLAAQAGKQAAEVARLFAHLGIKAVDAAAGARFGPAYENYKAEAAALPESAAQVQMMLARYCLATRLNCLSRYLPTTTSQPALNIIDELLVATVAGLAGESSGANLTGAVQSRSLLAMRFGGALTGAETTAPSQHVCSVAAIERFIAQTGTEQELRGVEPSVLRRVRDRIQARGANAASGHLTPLEAGLAGDVDLINSAHADPAFKELRQRSTRGGDERRRGLAAEAEAELRAAGDGAGEVAAVLPLVVFEDLGPSAGKSRALSDGLWGRAFLAAYNSGTAEERQRMVEGLSKGAGLALLAVPMVEAFTFNQAQFRRILIKHLGLAGDVSVPWTHHCGNGATRTLTASTINHLEVCPMLGRNSAPHNAVRDVLAHMVKYCGLTDAAVVESPVQSADGDSTVADVVYIDSASGQRVILEVSVVTVGSDAALAGSARAGLEGTTALLRAREEEKRNHGVIRKLLNDAGNNTIFTPIVMSASGAMGPSMIAFLQGAYERAKAANKFEMWQQSKLHYSWNTMVASSFWDMRLSVACVATDAEFQNRLIQRDRTLNFPVVARQPNSNPNFAHHVAHHAAAHRHLGA